MTCVGGLAIIAEAIERNHNDIIREELLQLPNQVDQRKHHALRKHIDCLLSSGASLAGRDPVRLSLEDRTLTVSHGMLVNEDGYLDLLEAISDLERLDPNHRGLAIEICLQQLSQAIDCATDNMKHSANTQG